MCGHYEEPNDGDEIIHFLIFSNKINIVEMFEVTNIDEEINYETYDGRNSQNARKKCHLDRKRIYLLQKEKNCHDSFI